MTTTITYDPDDPRGCIDCPLFHGVPRDGGCRALDGPGMHTLNHGPNGRFVPDPRCPLRNGGVDVRGPATGIDADNETEPARGDAVRINGPVTSEEALAAMRLMRDDIRSIATALSMAPDAMPGAIVERVEQFARDHGYVRNALGWMTSEPLDTSDVIVKVRQLERARDEAVTEGERRIAAIERERNEMRVERDASAARYVTTCIELSTLRDVIRDAFGAACTGDLVADVKSLVREAKQLRDGYHVELARKLGMVEEDQGRIASVATLDEIVAYVRSIEEQNGTDRDILARTAAMHRRAQRAESRAAALTRSVAKRDAKIDQTRKDLDRIGAAYGLPRSMGSWALADVVVADRAQVDDAAQALSTIASRVGLDGNAAAGDIIAVVGDTRSADLVAARLAAHAALDGLVGMAAGRTVGVVVSAEHDAAGRPLASERSE